MPAFVIVEIEIHNQELYNTYTQLTPESIASYQGKFVARGGDTTVLEGDWQPKRLVLLEFPSVDIANSWWHSEEITKSLTSGSPTTTTATKLLTFDQRRYKCRAKKSTSLRIAHPTEGATSSLTIRCSCRVAHQFDGVFEKTRNGEPKQWASTKLARYPQPLADAIGKEAIARLVQGEGPLDNAAPPFEHSSIFPPQLRAAVDRCFPMQETTNATIAIRGTWQM